MLRSVMQELHANGLAFNHARTDGRAVITVFHSRTGLAFARILVGLDEANLTAGEVDFGIFEDARDLLRMIKALHTARVGGAILAETFEVLADRDIAFRTHRGSPDHLVAFKSGSGQVWFQMHANGAHGAVFTVPGSEQKTFASTPAEARQYISKLIEKEKKR